MFQQFLRTTLGALAVLSFVHMRLGGQEVVTGGPRPEMRALLDAFAKGLNGAPESWEAMAKERFSPAFLKERSSDERKALFDKIRAQFGTVTFERVTREDTDAPLQVHVKGSTGAVGTVELTIEESATPRIAKIVIYEPLPNGKLRLIGADFLILADAWNSKHPEGPPQLMGQLLRTLAAFQTQRANPLVKGRPLGIEQPRGGRHVPVSLIEGLPDPFPLRIVAHFLQSGCRTGRLR
jgi:hypothetical protein